MDNSISKSGVYSTWAMLGKNILTSSSGFVCRKLKNGIYILTTCHQLDSLVENNYLNVAYENLSILVSFSDGSMHWGSLVAHNRHADLSLVHIRLTEAQLSAPPISEIEVPLLSEDPPYPLQPICTIHHPAMSGQSLHFQHDSGHIVDPVYFVPNSQQPARVHYHLPLAMSGSSGAPLIERNSNRLVGMVCGVYLGTTTRGREPAKRRYAISPHTITTWLLSLNLGFASQQQELGPVV